MHSLFAKRLKQLRCEANLSQKQLAVSLRISASTYSNYENGIYPPPLEKLCMLSKELHCSLDYLCGLSDFNVPYAKLTRHVNIQTNLYQFLQLLCSLDTPELSELFCYTEYLLYKKTISPYLPNQLPIAAEEHPFL